MKGDDSSEYDFLQASEMVQGSSVQPKDEIRPVSLIVVVFEAKGVEKREDYEVVEFEDVSESVGAWGSEYESVQGDGEERCWDPPAREAKERSRPRGVVERDVKGSKGRDIEEVVDS